MAIARAGGLRWATKTRGPGSAERFRGRAERLGVPSATARIPNLADDVDTLGDLERLDGRLGPHTSAVFEELRAGLTL